MSNLEPIYLLHQYVLNLQDCASASLTLSDIVEGSKVAKVRGGSPWRLQFTSKEWEHGSTSTWLCGRILTITG